MSRRTAARIAALLGTAAFAIGAVPAMAANGNHSEPGEPGTPNCHGQEVAFGTVTFAPEVLGVHGFSGIAKAQGESVKELQEAVREFCA
jgi:hypothetical protein